MEIHQELKAFSSFREDLSLFDQQILAGSFLWWGFQHQHAPSESVN
jgi:hypothetical protein